MLIPCSWKDREVGKMMKLESETTCHQQKYEFMLKKYILQENGYILSIHMYISKMIFYVIDYINCGTVSI